jgi:hypothetical protein
MSKQFHSLADVDPKDVLTPEIAARLIYRKAGYIRARIREGELKANDRGGWLIRGSDFLQWAEREKSTNEITDNDAIGMFAAIGVLGFGASKAAQKYKGLATYFIGDVYRVPNPIKIGKATNAAKRLAQLQTGYPAELRIWALVPGDHEAAYHRAFKEHRVKGEWFRLAPEIIKEINRLNTPERSRYKG